MKQIQGTFHVRWEAEPVPGPPGVVYRLRPSSTQIKRKKDGKCSPSKISCERIVKIGNEPQKTSDEGILYYQFSNGQRTRYASELTMPEGAEWLEFDWVIDELSVDKETIQIVVDGQDGIRGLQGIQGEKGEDGIQGPKGDDGQSQYFHIKYSKNSNGNPMTETPSTYIGTYVDSNPKDPEGPEAYKLYTWSRLEGIQGPSGGRGIPGQPGDNGKTSYLHIKYSNDGGKTFTPKNPPLDAGETPGDWIGQYTDFESDDKMDVLLYKWSKIKGETGDTGKQGPTGLSKFKSTVFKRQTSSPISPETDASVTFKGSYANPVPTGWFDGIPSGNLKLWASTCIFYSDGRREAWTTPREMTSTSSMIIRYCSNPGKPGTPDSPMPNYPWYEKSNSASIWMAIRTINDGVSSAWEVSRIKGETGGQGETGPTGLDGCSVRTTEWAENVEYLNETSSTKRGMRYLDQTVVSSMNNFRIFSCKKNHTSSKSNMPPNNEFWTELNKTQPTYTPLLIADNAVMRFGQANQFYIMDEGVVTAKYGGGTYPIMVGSVEQAMQEGTHEAAVKYCNFLVDDSGRAWLNQCNIRGAIKADRGYFRGFIRKGITQIMPSNMADYIVERPEAEGGDYIDFNKLSPIIYLQGSFQEMSICRLPSFDYHFGTYTPQQINEARSYIGIDFLVYNYSSMSMPVTGHLIDKANEDSGSYHSIAINPRTMAHFTCKVRLKNGRENVYWLEERIPI